MELGDDARSIVALLPALELADPPDLDQDVETILAGNIFHRAVAFGPRVETDAPGAARILVNGEEQHVIDRRRRRGANLDAHGRRGGAGAWRTPASSCARASASSPACSRRRTRRGRATRCGSSSTQLGSVELRFA